MDKLIDFIKTTYSTEAERTAFCEKCGTTWGYVKKIRHTEQLLRESVCINFERESSGTVKCEEMRPDVDWAYIRGTRAVA